MVPEYKKRENQDLFLDRDFNTTFYDMLMKARYNYKLYLKLVEKFQEEYLELTKVNKDIRYDTISFKNILGEGIIYHEYFLLVNNNDLPRLSNLLNTYGKYLAVKLSDLDDIYSYPGDGIAKFISNGCVVSEETKKLIDEKIGFHINDWRRRKQTPRGNSADQNGITNILTGEVVRPTNGNYSIEDFR